MIPLFAEKEAQFWMLAVHGIDLEGDHLLGDIDEVVLRLQRDKRYFHA